MDTVLIANDPSAAMNVERLTSHTSRLAYRWLNPAAWVLLGYALLALMIWVGGPQALRAGLAAALMLFGSGYSLVSALFARSMDLDALERAALAGGLGLAVGGILGLALARSEWHLEVTPLLITAFCFNLLCYAVLAYGRGREVNLHAERRSAAPAAHAPGDVVNWIQRRVATQDAGGVALTLALATALALGVWVLSRGATVPAVEPPMTEFYLLDANGLVEDFPTSARPGQTFFVRFGITNREGEAEAYQVEAVIGSGTIGRSDSMRLEAGETRQVTMLLVWPEQGATAVPSSQRVEFVLYREGERHRALHLWLDVERAEAAILPTDAALGSGQ